MKKLLKYFKGYILQTILSPIFKLCEVIFELLVPIVMAQIIDVGIKNNDTSYIFKMGGLLVLFGISGLAFALTAQYFAAKSAVTFSSKIRADIFKKINSLTYSQLDSLGTSTIITRMTSDVNQLQNGVNITLRLALRSPFVVFGALFMAFMIDAKSSIIFLITIALLLIVIFAILLSTIPLYKKSQLRLDKITKRTRENLKGVRIIRAFALEDSEKQAFVSENDLLNKAQIFVGKISALLNPLTFVIINIAIAVLIYIGAIRVESGAISQGAVVALYNYMTQILVELIKLANVIITMNKSFASASRVNEVLEMTPNLIENAEDTIDLDNEIAIEFDNVSLSYTNNGENALSNITFKLKKGQTLGIIGGTGSGKSSVANLIPHFYDATNGTVKVFGKDVKNLNTTALRENIGIVLQSARLFSGTIKENILWGNENANEEQIISALKSAQCYDFIEKLDNGIDSPVSQNGKNFSGGQKQRLSIARAIVKQPKILILDDSSSALDYATDLKLRRAIKDLPFNPTTVIISQRTSSIMNCDIILVLEDGKIVGQGTHNGLLEACEIYNEIHSFEVNNS